MSAPNIIPSIFTAKDMLTMPVMRMSTAVNRLGIVSQASMARMERSFTAVGASAMALSRGAIAIGTGIVLPLGLAVDQAIKFEKGMGNVATIVDTTKEDMGAMGDEVMKMGRQIPVTLADLQESLYQVRSAGIEAGNGINQAMGVLKSSAILSVAGLSSATEATKALTSAMVVFGDEGLTSEQIANSFFKTVQDGKTKMDEINVAFGKNAGIVHAAGVSLQELNAMTAALTNSGMAASAAQIGIAGAVTALIKPSTDLTTVYESMGYSGQNAFKDIVKASGGLVNAMMKIDAQGSKMGIAFSDDFREKRAMLTDILLSGPLHGAYLKNYADQMSGTNTLMTAYGKQQETAAARMKIFKTNVQELGINIGNLLIPPLNKLMSLLTPVIDGIADFAHNHKLLSGVIVDSLGTIGLLSLGIGGVSLGIGGVSLAVSAGAKAFGLLKGVMTAYNFVAGFAAVKTGQLTGALLEVPSAARGAQLAMYGFSAATKAAFGWITLGFASYMAWKAQMEKDNKNKDNNPLGFDYNKPFSDKYNSEKAKQNGISKSQFDKQQGYYQYNWMNNNVADANGDVAKWIKSLRSPSGPSAGQPSFDSTLLKKQLELNQKMDEDSSFNKYKNSLGYNAAPYIPARSMDDGAGAGMQTHQIEVVIRNESDRNVTTSTRSNSAGAVPITVKTTYT